MFLLEYMGSTLLAYNEFDKKEKRKRKEIYNLVLLKNVVLNF